MTLGTLQRSHLQIAEQVGQKWYYGELNTIWTEFSRRFVNGEVGVSSGDNPGSGNVDAALVLEARKRIALNSLAQRIKTSQIRPIPPLKRDGPLPLRENPGATVQS
jgi:hypothetical protein